MHTCVSALASLVHSEPLFPQKMLKLVLKAETLKSNTRNTIA